MFSKQEKKQYHRHLILDQIGVLGQKKLKAAKVLVIGAGGLGCPVLQYLTAAGVGTIGIVDGDTVDLSNLQRQVLYTTQDVDQNKAQVAAARLKFLNPHITLKTYPEFITKDNVLTIFGAYDFIVDGSDNFPTRYLVNDACVLTDKPLVFGSIFKFQGQVSVFNYQGSGTYRCLFPTPPVANSVPNCSDIGVLGVLPGIIGALQANEAIKLITGIGELLVNKLLYFDALTLQQQLLAFQKNSEATITALEEDYELFCGVTQANVHKSIKAEEAEAYLKEYTVLDVRTYREFEDENIGGIHVPLEELEDRLDEISTQQKMVVCCATGRRSAAAILTLEQHLPNVDFINLEDGLDAYFNL